MAVFPRPGNTDRPDSRASCGGVEEFKQVPNYSPPQGPKGIENPKSPGLHGDNLGPCGTQRKG